MSISVTFSNTHRILLSSPFFITRRPVLDRRQSPVAQDLLLCGAAGGEQEEGAASVIGDVVRHGWGRVTGELPAYVLMNEAALMSDLFRFLPAHSVIPVIAADVAPTPAALERVAALAQGGFRFALDTDGGRAQAGWMPLIDVIRVDVRGRIAAELAGLCGPLLQHRKLLLAENVESADRFQLCCDAGFEAFQGYYFTQRRPMGERKIKPSQLAVIELISLLASEAESVDIENSIKHDASLGLNLLRLVNTPAVSAHRIDSLHQALMVLGRNQLQRWLQVMLYAASGAHGKDMRPLLTLATTRGRLMELAAQRLRPGNRGIADTAFTVGIMSLMDALFGIPMEDILTQMPVVQEVGDALLTREGYQGELLMLAEQTEWADKNVAELLHTMERLRLSHHDLYALQLAAFEWSDHVSRHV